MTHLTRSALGVTLSLFVGGAAMAMEGVTSGPAAGKSVVPSTAIQKEYEGRSAAGGQVTLGVLEASGLAAGMPGVEGKPGAQSGQAVSRRRLMTH